MRLGIVFSLIFTFGLAQEKHLTSDFNLSKDVVKYETVSYRLGKTAYEPSETDILEFKDGKLVRKIHKDEDVLDLIYNSEESFVYDSSGKLLKVISEKKSTFFYVYDKKGKLIQIKQDTKFDPIIEDFTYDTKGNLVKWVKKAGNFIDQEKVFYDYKDNFNYKYKHNQYYYKKSELSFSKIVEIKNGVEISSKFTNAKDGKITTSNFTYDSYKNQIKVENSGGFLSQTFYGYDGKGNVIKEKCEEDGKLYSKFSKVTFKDGTTSGSTAFAPYFTKGTQQPILLMEMNKNPKEKYKIKKTGPTQYEVKNSKGEMVLINPKESMIFEQKDMLFYDAKTNETAVLFGLFTDAYKSNEWYDTVTYNSPTGKYIVVNSDWNFFIIEKGNVVESSQYKLHKGIDGNTLVIAENGKEKYFVPYLDQMQALVIYPLELISK
jgi:hypothetical protein